MTKKFEEPVRGDLAEAVEHFRINPPRGEITLVVEGRDHRLVNHKECLTGGDRIRKP